MTRALLVLAWLAALLVAAPADATPRWGWLGVRIRDLSEQEIDEISKKYGLREGFGALIVEVLKDTPADAAGLRPGDIVVAIQSRPIVDTRTLQRAVSSASVGETMPITVLRRDQGRRPLSVRLGLMPEPMVAERVAAEYGFFVGDGEGQPELGGARPPGAPPSVTGVVPRSRAEVAGLRPGDVFLEVDGRPVGTLGALRDVLLNVTPDAPLSLVVRRDREQVTVSLDRAKTP